MQVHLYRKQEDDIQVWGTYEKDTDFWYYSNIIKIPLSIFEAKQIQEKYKRKSIYFWVEQIN